MELHRKKFKHSAICIGLILGHLLTPFSRPGNLISWAPSGLLSNSAQASPHGPPSRPPTVRPPAIPQKPPPAIKLLQQRKAVQQRQKAATQWTPSKPQLDSRDAKIGKWEDLAKLSLTELAAYIEEMGDPVGTLPSTGTLLQIIELSLKQTGASQGEINGISNAMGGIIKGALDQLKTSSGQIPNATATEFKKEYGKTCMCNANAFATALGKAETTIANKLIGNVVNTAFGDINKVIGAIPGASSGGIKRAIVGGIGTVTVVYNINDPEVAFVAGLVSNGYGGKPASGGGAVVPPAGGGGVAVVPPAGGGGVAVVPPAGGGGVAVVPPAGGGGGAVVPPAGGKSIKPGLLNLVIKPEDTITQEIIKPSDPIDVSSVDAIQPSDPGTNDIVISVPDPEKNPVVPAPPPCKTTACFQKALDDEKNKRDQLKITQRHEPFIAGLDFISGSLGVVGTVGAASCVAATAGACAPVAVVAGGLSVLFTGIKVLVTGGRDAQVARAGGADKFERTKTFFGSVMAGGLEEAGKTLLLGGAIGKSIGKVMAGAKNLVTGTVDSLLNIAGGTGIDMLKGDFSAKQFAGDVSTVIQGAMPNQNKSQGPAK